MKELCQYDDLTGIHFDYIRFPDVILPDTLQPRYGIVQDRESSEYDYCYCSVCRKGFEQQTGRNPMAIEDPSTDKEWIHPIMKDEKWEALKRATVGMKEQQELPR